MPDSVRRRVTADDYERFVTELCAMPPGPERDDCVKDLAGRLLALYAGLGVEPPAGLSGFAARLTHWGPPDGRGAAPEVTG